MAELSALQPLLAERKLKIGYSKNKPILQHLGKLILKSLIWVIFLLWVSAMFALPTGIVRRLLSKWNILTHGAIFGTTGTIFLSFSAPILVVALLGFIYVAAFFRENVKNNYKFPRYSLWTFPVLVDGPFGVVSAAELIGILILTVYVFWSVTAYAVHDHSLIERFSLTLRDKSLLMLELIGLRLGLIGLLCLAFLFLMVARGSILLRMTDIPFEQAARYHVFLGHITMAIFTLHGLFYVVVWAIQGQLLQQILEWKDIGIANLPGVISLAAGLLMWVTSLRPVRRTYFEIFFYSHQLYVIFVVFLALHVGDFIFSYAAGAIFLFILDRFLRFCQSRTTVNVLSAVCHPCGTLEFILSKPPRLQYNSLSFIFLQVRELPWLQWHPFSVSSSPLDGTYHLSVLIKVLGDWTTKLSNIITSNSEQPQKDLQFEFKGRITASVEGPYGHELPYHLMYENLILVAGGIGISPFFAILSDILHLSNEGKTCFPKNILVIWAVKKSKELSLLSTINAHSICPSFSDKLHLEIQSYVTQESEPSSLEEGRLTGKVDCTPLFGTTANSISCLVGTGNNFWAGVYVLVSIIGFIMFYALLELYYLKPLQVFTWWYRGLLFTLCMVAGAVIPGSIVIFWWNKWERKSSSSERWMINTYKKNGVDHGGLATNTEKDNIMSVQTIRYGSRPDFRTIFSSFGERMGYANVGVIVCGPPGLQSSVARECRHQNTRGKLNHPIFHFNSHSFDL